jgi:NAD-dependent deacetylase
MKHIVILTGAGISAESGLKTFRDSDGLWEGYNVYDVASPMGWASNPQLVLDFYNMRRADVLAALPNLAHFNIKKLEQKYAVTIITQNIDDLHERAGSANILHLHGQITKCCSVKNKQKTYPYLKDLKIGDVDTNGDQLRPFIVWFGEDVPMMQEAASISMTADIFIVIGTSLQVYPAASLIDYLPEHCEKFVIDKQIPNHLHHDFQRIEAVATEGTDKLLELLL